MSAADAFEDGAVGTVQVALQTAGTGGGVDHGPQRTPTRVLGHQIAGFETGGARIVRVQRARAQRGDAHAGRARNRPGFRRGIGPDRQRALARGVLRPRARHAGAREVALGSNGCTRRVARHQTRACGIAFGRSAAAHQVDCAYTASMMTRFLACSFSGMYRRTASCTSARLARSSRAARAPRNAVLGMGLPSTAEKARRRPRTRCAGRRRRARCSPTRCRRA